VKIKIDKDGALWIERAGKWKDQSCPHRFYSCGDHCPLFSEPMREEGYAAIDICDHHRLEGEITDERGKQ
jgi:hypothetical protein